MAVGHQLGCRSSRDAEEPVAAVEPLELDLIGLLERDVLTDDDVGKIQAPTLVFTGDRDAQVPLDLAVSLYKVLPNAELAVCPDTDHFAPMRPERAGMFAAMIRDFVSRHGGQ